MQDSKQERIHRSVRICLVAKLSCLHLFAVIGASPKAPFSCCASLLPAFVHRLAASIAVHPSVSLHRRAECLCECEMQDAMRIACKAHSVLSLKLYRNVSVHQWASQVANYHSRL